MQRYFAKEDGNELLLKDSDIHHIKNVMRMKENDLIEVIYNRKLYNCRIESLNPFKLKVMDVSLEEKSLNIDITIAVGLVKEQKMDLILQKLTELGVNRIIPVNMERSIVKLDSDKFIKKKERWERICKEASEQSKRDSVPVIENIMNIKDLVRVDSDIKMVASTRENKMLKGYLQELNDYAKIIVVVGPEGGLSEKEEDYLFNNGFDKVSFGNLIFRVETACIYIASILNYYSSMR